MQQERDFAADVGNTAHQMKYTSHNQYSVACATLCKILGVKKDIL
ncbi:hypothetical protein ACEYW6_34990 [Nostoc sp. UIC 10607]